MPQKSLLLIGSGPLIGVEVAKIFAQNKFSRIALLSRSLSHLQRERETILSSLQDSTTQHFTNTQHPTQAQHSTQAQPSTEAQPPPKIQLSPEIQPPPSPKPQTSPEIKLWTADTTNPTSVVEAVREVGSWLGGKLDVFVYNAARVHRSSLLEWEGDEVIIGDFKTTTLTPHHLLPILLPLLLSTTKPSIFITTSRLSLTPSPNFVTLSILKAAQRSLILSLQHEFGSKIHIALVYINGIVGREGEEGMGDGFGGRLLDPKEIAGVFWGLYTDEKYHWRGEVDFGEWKS